MKKDQIITSLYTYNHSLFTSYLDGTIKINVLPELIKPYYKSDVYYEKMINFKDFVIDMQALNHVMYVCSSNKLKAYDLKSRDKINSEDIFIKEVPDCTNIKIDYKRNYLFVLSKSRGIVALKISNPRRPQFKTDLIPENFDSFEEYNITEFDVYDGMIFLSVRNLGIIRIDYMDSQFSKPKIIREIQKISLEDPQDVKYSSRNKYLYVADSIKGFIIIDIQNNQNIFEMKLPDDDFPQKILLYYTNAIIKGKKSVYYYNNNEKTITKIIDSKIGDIETYYKQIIYSKEGRLNFLKLGELTDNDLKKIRNSEINFNNVNSLKE